MDTSFLAGTSRVMPCCRSFRGCTNGFRLSIGLTSSRCVAGARGNVFGCLGGGSKVSTTRGCCRGLGLARFRGECCSRRVRTTSRFKGGRPMLTSNVSLKAGLTSAFRRTNTVKTCLTDRKGCGVPGGCTSNLASSLHNTISRGMGLRVTNFSTFSFICGTNVSTTSDVIDKDLLKPTTPVTLNLSTTTDSSGSVLRHNNAGRRTF